MNELTLADLHNPEGVTAILTTRGKYIEADDDQGWQEYPGSWELWQIVDGGLMRVQRWLKKSVVCWYKAPKTT